MGWWKAVHLIAVVSWFAGLFYLPRLFVYHAMAESRAVQLQFKTMERKLYYAITWPAALLTTVSGSVLLNFNKAYYLEQPWMQGKLMMIAGLWLFHFACGHFLKRFAKDEQPYGHVAFRYFNEIPTIFLIGIMILVFVQPTLWGA